MNANHTSITQKPTRADLIDEIKELTDVVGDGGDVRVGPLQVLLVDLAHTLHALIHLPATTISKNKSDQGNTQFITMIFLIFRSHDLHLYHPFHIFISYNSKYNHVSVQTDRLIVGVGARLWLDAGLNQQDCVSHPSFLAEISVI